MFHVCKLQSQSILLKCILGYPVKLDDIDYLYQYIIHVFFKTESILIKCFFSTFSSLVNLIYNLVMIPDAFGATAVAREFISLFSISFDIHKS